MEGRQTQAHIDRRWEPVGGRVTDLTGWDKERRRAPCVDFDKEESQRDPASWHRFCARLGGSIPQAAYPGGVPVLCPAVHAPNYHLATAPNWPGQRRAGGGEGRLGCGVLAIR